MPCRPQRGGPAFARPIVFAVSLFAGFATFASPAGTTSAERGRLLLAQYQCGSCHGIPGVASAGGRLASSLKGFGARSYIAGRLANGPQALARWIQEPKALVPDTLMPSMGVSPADARDMAAYLLELK